MQHPILPALDRLHTAITNHATATGSCLICGGEPNECFPDCAVGNARSTIEFYDRPNLTERADDDEAALEIARDSVARIVRSLSDRELSADDAIVELHESLDWLLAARNGRRGVSNPTPRWRTTRATYGVTHNGDIYAGLFDSHEAAREWINAQPNAHNLRVIRTIEEEEVAP